ncbi:MAG: hypothetical protein AB7G13_23445 [Lautropia sp.]
MSSPSDRDARRPAAIVIGIAVLIALAPLSARSGLAGAPVGGSDEAPKLVEAEPKSADPAPKVLERHDARPAPAASTGTYQLRCWQQGRLVFEENGVKVDVEDGGRYSTKVRGTDRQGDKLVVADTRNATCLIRAERPDGRPR